ncbi:MAG: site-specific integrase [Bacteroidota bacterium]|nr:site-specific integrase [Bacteroidota bacterium]
MAIPRLYIDEKKKKKDGFVSIYCMVHIESKTIKINTNVSVLYERFDVVKGRIKGNTKEDNDNNLIIDRCLSLINEIFVRYRLQNRVLTADLLLLEYKNPSMYIDFYTFFDKKINERIRAKEIGAESGKHHRVLLNKLKEFKPALSFAEIDLKFLVSFRNFCRITKGNSVNTNQKTFAYFSCYLNIAKREEIISNNPLELLEFKRIDVHMSFLTEVELKKLVKYYDREEFQENLHKILRHFLFCCLTGIRRSDFKRLERKHLHENTLKFIPHKTRNQKAKELHIPLIEKAKKLIQDENFQSVY